MAHVHHITLKDAHLITDIFTKTLIQVLPYHMKDGVVIRNLGKFYGIKPKARLRHNVNTGITELVESKCVPKMEFAESLKENIERVGKELDERQLY